MEKEGILYDIFEFFRAGVHKGGYGHTLTSPLIINFGKKDFSNLLKSVVRRSNTSGIQDGSAQDKLKLIKKLAQEIV